MTDLVHARDFGRVHDIGRVRVAVDELRAVHSLLAQFADVAAEMPGIELERVAGISASVVVIARRLGAAEARVTQLCSEPGAGVTVVDPDRGRWVDTPYGQPVLPVISAPRVPGVRGLSSGVIRLTAGSYSLPCVNPGADAIVVVLFGTAAVDWWDANGEVNQSMCRRHQHAHIPRGVPHAMSNPGPVPMLAVVVHSAPKLAAGFELHPGLGGGLAAEQNESRVQEAATNLA